LLIIKNPCSDLFGVISMCGMLKKDRERGKGIKCKEIDK